MCEQQVIHCCCLPGKHGERTYSTLAKPPAFRQQGAVDFYWDCCVECAQNDWRPLLRDASWFHTIRPSTGLGFRPSDLLSLLFTCKGIWREAEPIAWKTFTLRLGLAQFEAFHKRFLQLPLRSKTSQASKYNALWNLHLSVPNLPALGSQIGHDCKSYGLSGQIVVEDACRRSIKALRECSNLHNINISVSRSSKLLFLDTIPRHLCPTDDTVSPTRQHGYLLCAMLARLVDSP
jgi:hypothetical protein